LGYQRGEYKGRYVHIAPYYDNEGRMVAQKLRYQDKQFRWLGDPSEALPFGAHAFPKSGRKIVVTEGEIDALSMSQVQGNKWPVVSIGCGAGPQVRKYMAQQKDYFAGFEEVVLMFDTDEPGRQAAIEAAKVLGVKCKIAELPSPFKDVNEMLLEGRAGGITDAMWRALPYRPEGLVEFSSQLEAVKKTPAMGLSIPWPSLSKVTFGLRRGELWAFGAGTGIGKTTLFVQFIHHLIKVHNVPVAGFFLEQQVAETARRVAGIEAEKTFHVPESGWVEADIDGAFDRLKDCGKLFLYDSFGNNTWDTIKEKIEYLHHAEGVNYFFLDHLTALATWQSDERQALDLIMSEMGGIVKKLNITIVIISHLSTPEGKPHEEGGRVTIKNFRGSRSIGYWCHLMLGMERNQQADDPAERSVTTLRVLKDRFTGQATGETITLKYGRDTGLLNESDKFAPHQGFADETASTGEQTSEF
jgi:twinkle protein